MAATLIPVVSSNVEGAGFDKETDELVVRYLTGEYWAYRVGPIMAADFFQAASKGMWLWDNVRVRGTKHLHRVPARQLTWRG